MTGYAGRYPLESRPPELERLRIQSAAMAPDAQTMLDRIGVGQGWSCVDLGCGPHGLVELLAPRVGPTGQVLGLDRNQEFLEHARRVAQDNEWTNASFRAGDVYHTGLAAESFDLVHSRFVASTAGAPEQLIAEAMRLARPGGIVALQEPDGSTLECYPPHPAWQRLKAALLGAFAGVGADLTLARRLYYLMCHAGLDDVQYRTFLVAVRSTDPMVDYLPSTVESLTATVVRLGLLSAVELPQVLAECRHHLRRPEVSFTMYTVAQVWGRKAGSRH